jgi:hypothetical protein
MLTWRQLRLDPDPAVRENDWLSRALLAGERIVKASTACEGLRANILGVLRRA